MRIKLKVGTPQVASLGSFVTVTSRGRTERGCLERGGCLQCAEGATFGCESPPAAAIQSCSVPRRIGGGGGLPAQRP